MARLIVKIEKEPKELVVGEKKVRICMCGLSKNQPFCNDSHLVTKDEKDDEIYEYDEDGKRVDLTLEEEGGCCGGGCCGNKEETTHEK